jgi:putative acetyltransferase
MEIFLQRTTGDNKDFQLLLKELDYELWFELQEDQATYDQFNIVINVPTAVVVYINNEPVACGCFKPFNLETVEIKRMFVRKDHRGKGLSKKVLSELECWAREQGFKYAVLETSVHFETACKLYTSSGYKIISNYGPYVDLPESVCMRKQLVDR